LYDDAGGHEYCLVPDWAYLIFGSILSLGKGPVRGAFSGVHPFLNATTVLSLNISIEMLRSRLLSCLGNELNTHSHAWLFILHACCSLSLS
jgi:hypothetical protein